MPFSILESLLGLAAKVRTNDKPNPGRVQVEAWFLEDRLLYSATVLPVDMASADTTGIGFEITQGEIDAIMDCIEADLSSAMDVNSQSFEAAATDSAVIASESASDQLTCVLLVSESSDSDALSTDVADAQDAEAVESEPEPTPDVASVNLAAGPAPRSESDSDESSINWASNESALTEPTGRYGLVFVDARVEDADQLLVGLGLDDHQVYYLSPDTDGLAYITEILSHFDAQSVASIHLLGHGGAGAIELGKVQLTSDNLPDYSAMLSSWSNVLSADADILIYGCDVAKTESGQDLLNEISTLTGADLAGSTDITASARLGGDWELEYSTGLIETRLEANFELLDHYLYAMVTGTSNADFIVGTSAFDSHSGLGGNDLIMAGANVIADGQFTSGTVSSTWTTYNSGATMGGWTVTSGSVDLQSASHQPTPTGGRSVDMDGSAPGTISQTINTVAGNTYVMRFMMTANATGASTKALEVSIGGNTKDYSITTTSGHTYAASEWFEQTYVFTATNATTTINIRSLSNSGNAGAVIGDVAIADLTTANGNDTLAGDDGNDTLVGSGGNDTINGGNGNDTIFAGRGSNTIDGGANSDVVVFTGNRADYDVTVAGSTYTVTDLRSGTPDGTNTITNVESFRFNDGDLTAAQATVRPAIFENFEDGSLSGWSGGTTVTSQSAFSDFLTSATTFNSPNTAASALGVVGVQDVFKTFSLSGHQTSVTIAFNFYRIDSWDNENFLVYVNDVAVSTRAFNQSTTTNHVDTTSDSGSTALGFQGGWDEEVVTYVLTVNTTATTLKLGFGSTIEQQWNDEAWGVDNLSIREQIVGSTGTYAEGTTGADSLGSTWLSDSYAGGAGNDTLSGAAGNDFLSGGHGLDSLDGGTGNDTILGGWGADTMAGGLGSDNIEGGDGADVIYGGGMNLILNGSFESSTTSWTTGGQVTSLSSQGSTLGSSAAAFGSTNTANNGSLSQTVSTTSGSDYTVGFDYWSWGTTGVNQSLRFRIISGGFTVVDTTVTATGNGSSPAYTDYVYTFTALGSSTQVLFDDVSATTSSIDGMLDNIRLFLDDAGADRLNVGSGGDVVYGGAGDDVIYGGSGADSLFGDGGSDTLSYSSSNAAVTVNLSTSTASGGYAASDRFYNFENVTGSAFNDTLTGDSGNNVLRGNGGNDALSGGTGMDTAVYSGNWSNYTISYNSGTQNYTVVDNRANSPDGTDTLSSIEYLQFADQTLQTSLAVTNAPSAISLNQRTVSITNSSFESNVVSDGSTSTSATGWTITASQGGTINPNSTQLAENVSSGTNALWLNAGTASQTTSEIFSSTQTYTLMVDVGDRLDTAVGTIAVRLYAGTVLLGEVTSITVPQGGWQTVTLTVDGTSFGGNASALGQALRVEFASSGSQVLFDNVRLVAADRVLAVAENSANGTVVGTATALDPDTWDNVTYSLTDNAGGRFAINSTTGAITVANSSLLNHESAVSHTVTVRATDTSGATFDRTVTIGVSDVNEAPTDLTSGINLNTDGGNNSYLRTTSGGSIFGGRTALTLEAVYSMANNASSESPLISYAVAGADNEVYLRISPTGALTLAINNTQIFAPSNSALIDGKLHAVAVSWDNTNGDVRFYIDGQLWHTATGLKVGTTLQSGGTLVVGQDQDTVDGGYNAAQRFSGTLYGLRIWNNAISDEQVARNYQQNLATTETGLVADYRMSGLVGGNTVVDSVSGNNLTTANVAVGGGFTASTTTASMSVAENSVNGTRVGQVLASDAEISRDIAFDGLFREGIVSGAATNYTNGQTFGGWTVTSGNVDLNGTGIQSSPMGGRSVELNGTSAGAIAQTLSTEVGRTYQLVYSFGGNFSGGDATKDLRVVVGGTTQDFALTQPSGWSASNVLWSNRTLNFTATSTSTSLNFLSLDTSGGAFGPMIADVRVMEVPATVAAILAADPTLSYNAATDKFYRAVNTTTSWTAAQTAAMAATINGVSGQLVTIGSQFENSIVQGLAQSINQNIWLGASDATSEGTWRWRSGSSDANTFWIGNSTGTQQANQWSNWSSGEPNDFGSNEDYVQLFQANGTWNDLAAGTNQAYVIEWDASEVLSNQRYSLTDSAGGRFAINANTGEITLANTSLINFESASSHAITVRVTDAAGQSYDETMTINVSNTNDAPVLSAYAPVYNTTENASAFSANVSAVLQSSVTDEDAGSVRGIAIHSVTGAGGTLQYSIDGGATWNNFSSPATTSALLLRSTDLVRFTPSTTNGGQMQLSYFAWDQTSGTAGSSVDASSRGGTTAFSSAGDVVTINTTSVNDAPTITNGHGYALTGTDENTTSSSTFSGTILLAAGWADVDTGAVGGMAITSTVGTGTWQYSTDGATWNNFGLVSNSNALLISSTTRIRYLPDGNNGETATFTYRSWDQTSGSVSTNVTASYGNATTNGGTSAYSSSVATASLVVTSVNDAPTITNGTTYTLSSTTEDIPSSGTLASAVLASSGWADIDTGAASGLAITATTGSGTWQYSTDGTNWNSFGAVSTTNALLITSTTQVRYLPDGNNGESATFTYQAWDQTSGTASTGSTASYAATTSSGGTTAFSSNSATASIVVTSVNDAPTINNGATSTLPSTNEDSVSSSIQGSTILATAGWADVDISALTGVAITGTTGNGTWQFSADGITWTNFGAVSSTNALLITSTMQLRYLPDGSNGEVATVIYRAWDQTTGTASANGAASYADTTANGGTTAFSTGLATASMMVTSVNDAPTITSGGSYVLSGTNEDTPSTGNLASAILAGTSWNDVDVGAASGLAITGTTGSGTWQYSTDGVSWRDFGAVTDTSALLITSSAQVRYLPDGNNGESATFTYRAWDQTSGTASTSSSNNYGNTTTSGGSSAYSGNVATASISVSSVNDAPTITNGSSYSLAGTNEDTTSSATVASAILAGASWNDVDTGAMSGLAITGTSGNGTWQYSTDGSTWSSFGAVTGTNALLVTSSTQVRYIPNGNNGETATFTYRAWDQTSGTASTGGAPSYADTTTSGGTTAFSTSVGTASMSVSSLNDAPVLDSSGNMSLSGITEDDLTNSGQTVASIVFSAGGDRITDVDSGAVEGIAITSLNSGNGTWQYSTDGNNWNDIGGVSNSLALLLRSTDLVRFIPNGENGTSADFSFKAWDQTSGTAGTKVDTSASGGLTAFSSQTEVASIVVTSVNDNPVAISDSATATESGGINNASVGTNPTGNVLTNDTDVDTGDTKTVVGVAAGSVGNASTNVGTAVSGLYGSIDIASDGAYTYTVDNNNSAVQALRTTGQTLTDVFTYTLREAAGLTSTTQVTVTIQGANDAPTAVTDTILASEAGGANNGTAGLNPTGNVFSNDTDPDSLANGETQTVIGVSAGTVANASTNVGSPITGSYGSITIAADGSYSYTVDNNNSVVQALRTSGNTLQDVFTYTMRDAAGLTSTTQVTVTIGGANDTPHNITATSLTVAENSANGTFVGTLTGQDVDSGDSISYSLIDDAGGRFSINAATGALSVANSGPINFEANTNHAIVVRVTDTQGAAFDKTFTVNVTNVNETPSGVADTATAVEAGGNNNGTAGTNPTGNVLSNDTDVDAGDTLSVVGVAAGSLADATANVGASVSGSYGTITIAANGTYTYTVDNSHAAVQALRSTANTLQDVFTYKLSDAGGLTSITQITITIQGANDAPVAVADNATAIEAGGINDATAGTSPTGNVLNNDTDVDAGDTRTVTGVAAGTVASAIGSVASMVVGTYGAVAIQGDGSYSYVVDDTNPAVQALRTSGQTLQDVFTYTITDAAGATSTTQLTITIQGANDAPVATADHAIAIEAGGVSNASAGTNPTGNVLTNDTDVDSGDNQTVVGVAAGTHASASGWVGSAALGNYGSLTINSDGSYTYNVDNQNATVQALRTSGETLSDVFSYTLRDAGGLESTTQLTIVIQGNNDAPHAIAGGPFTIDENASSGTAVGMVTAQDVDVGDTHTYSLIDSAGGRFAIQAATGAITVANGGLLNYEAATSHTVIVRVTDASGATFDQNFTIQLNDIDEFDVIAPLDSNAALNAIDENSTIGSVVGITAYSLDADSTNNTITYSLTDNSSGLFQIDANTGVVTTAAAIDRELHGATRSITVQATSSDGSIATQTFTIAVNDVDEFDVGAITDNNPASNSIFENASLGTVVGITASAQDLDATSNTITYTLVDDDGGRFAIHASSGVVTVAGSIDREADGANRQITVRATSSDGSTRDQLLTIAITDVDEADVSTPTDADASPNAISENVTIGTTVGLTAYAFDMDATNSTVIYTLIDSSAGLFQIDANTGVVSTAAAIDRESQGSSRWITVQATSSDGSVATQTFSIAINDVDEFDVGLVSDLDAGANSVTENAALGTTVGITARAQDGDATNSQVTYSLVNSDGGRFAIDTNTGVVTVAGAIDRENDGPTRQITIRATSADGSFTDEIYSIAIADANEFSVTTPVDTNLTQNYVFENVAVGSLVGLTAQAFDSDVSQNSITYSLSSNPGGLFQIDASTGAITTASAIDREAIGASVNITVQATSSDGSTATQSFTIFIGDVDEYDTTAVTDTNGSGNQVFENAATGTLVGITAFAADIDATTNSIIYTLTDNAGGRFAIDSVTGVVTLADGSLLDYETATSHGIIVRATSADGSFMQESYSIDLLDVNEAVVGAISDTDGSADTILENASLGSTVGISVLAVDPDGSDTVSYSLDNDGGGLFAIDTTSGVVTVAGAIDREQAASLTIVIRATSSDTSFSTRSFTINVTDVNEYSTSSIADANGSVNAVQENAAIGTLVGITALTTDADATNNSITYSLISDDGGRFAIDATTGVVTVAGAIDREADGPTRSITVRATSVDGSFSTQVLTIDVLDVDEFDTITPVDSDSTANQVAENAASGTLVGITGLASDSDATNNAITYSLDDDAGGRFTIDAVTGVVTVADDTLLNYESATQHTITIRATSQDGSHQTQQFTIALTDVNEVAVSAINDADGSSDFVLENTSVGTVVGLTAWATDADGTDTVSYSLDNSVGGRFAIDATTGVVTVAGALDRETAASHTITIRATSTDGSTSTRSFTIQIGDADEFDVTPISDLDAAINEVAENSAVGTVLGLTAFASDADATNQTITYSLVDDDGGRFAIDATTGIVTVAAAIDRETDGPSRSITVRATSADGSISQQTFTINVIDVNEFQVSQPIDSDATSNSIAENSASGTVVGVTAMAFDADATINSITYSLIDDDNGRFAIDSSTGVVTLATTLDRETDGPTRTLTIQATSADGSTRQQSFTIQVLDVDEFDVSIPIDGDATINRVTENSANGTTVGVTATAVDNDATNNGITYSLDNDAGGRFAIDSSTGVVTVAGNIDREQAASYDITVRATSQDGSSKVRTFTIAVNDVNEYSVSPIQNVAGGTVFVVENRVGGTLIGLTGSALDLDATNNAVTYSLTDNAGGRFQIDQVTGVVTVATGARLDFEALASHTIVMQAQSQDGSMASKSFTVQVINANEAPTASSLTYSINNVEVVTITRAMLLAAMSDPESDQLQGIVVSGPTNGSLVWQADGSLRYTPNVGFTGLDQVTFRASDGQLNSTNATITINVVLPPVQPDTGNSSSGSGSSSSGSSTSNSSSAEVGKPTKEAEASTNATPEAGQPIVDSRPAEAQRTFEATQSSGASLGPQGVASMEIVQANAEGSSSVSTMQISALNWSPITIGRFEQHSVANSEQQRGAGRRIEEAILVSREEMHNRPAEDQANLYAFSEPAKWTVISTGAIIWAVRLGHVITTFATAASAWIQFDPLTVIQNASVSKDGQDEEQVMARLFEKSNKKSGGE